MNPIEKVAWKETLARIPWNFGSIGWAHVQDDKREKEYAKTHAFIMMGYPTELMAYILFFPIK